MPKLLQPAISVCCLTGSHLKVLVLNMHSTLQHTILIAKIVSSNWLMDCSFGITNVRVCVQMLTHKNIKKLVMVVVT